MLPMHFLGELCCETGKDAKVTGNRNSIKGNCNFSANQQHWFRVQMAKWLRTNGLEQIRVRKWAESGVHFKRSLQRRQQHPVCKLLHNPQYSSITYVPPNLIH